MSIAVLNQVYDETRRLAVAGSAVAPGDFRLKKLLPPLEQAGAKAPVFAKAAECVKGVVESTEATSAPALLELAALVSAVLYTQGETGLPGPLEEIITTDLGGTAQQTSARVLKPLLEALTTTGSGRLELIKDAHERGAFKDLRLVKASLAALDDPYPEIAELIATKVMPLYGRAILSELKAKFDLKGKAGHPRRLRLMHSLDAAGTRELVEKTLEEGSKEVKVVAIECLGSEAKDIAFLVEQSAAKAQDVRRAAYIALAGIDDPAAVEVLQKAMTGKDVDNAVTALARSQQPEVLSHLIATIETELASLKKEKDKKAISAGIGRLNALLSSLRSRRDAATEALLNKLFGLRSELAKAKGDTASGTDLNEFIVAIMATSSKALQAKLAAAHTDLTTEELDDAFSAARFAWPADKVFAAFSPYLAVGKKEKAAVAKQNAIASAIHQHHHMRSWSKSEEHHPDLHPDWLDAAVNAENVPLVELLGRPGHAAQNRFLKQTFDALFPKNKDKHICQPVVSAMVALAHPDATDAFFAVAEKADKKNYWSLYHLEWLIPSLPATAIPRLEAMLPKLGERDADRWVDRIQQLREKSKSA